MAAYATTTEVLVRAFGAPSGVAALDAVLAGHVIAVDLAAEGDDGASVGGEFDVVDVDPALELAGLVRAFEVAGDDVAVLLELDGFEGAALLFDVLGVDGPVAGDIVGRAVVGVLFLGAGGGSGGEKNEQDSRDR
jgi:hypothetical protein